MGHVRPIPFLLRVLPLFRLVCFCKLRLIVRPTKLTPPTLRSCWRAIMEQLISIESLKILNVSSKHTLNPRRHGGPYEPVTNNNSAFYIPNTSSAFTPTQKYSPLPPTTVTIGGQRIALWTLYPAISPTSSSSFPRHSKSHRPSPSHLLTRISSLCS